MTQPPVEGDDDAHSNATRGETGATADREEGPKFPDWYDRSDSEAARAAVPEIGSGYRRWYDLPYRVLMWLSRSWRAKLIPSWARKILWRRVIVLIRHNELDRHKARNRDDPMHNMEVPDGEHVHAPTLWVVELFPPSAIAPLRALMRKYDPHARLLVEGDALTVLSSSRAGQGFDWFKLGSVASPATTRFVPDSYREPLPDAFWRVDLTAIQLGTGITALVARFHLTETGSTALDREWHRKHEPRIVRRWGEPIAEDRLWSAYSATQQTRRRAHDQARHWMAQHCPGLFALTRTEQPLVDLLLTEKHDPTDGTRPSRRVDDALRALGLTEHQIIESEQVPKLMLSPADIALCPTLRTRRTWALWGNRTVAAEARPDLSMYNGETDTPEALGHAADREMREFLIALSLTEMTALMGERYAELRDTARQQHDSFSARYINGLRRTLLTSSLDLSSASVDVPQWWDRHSNYIPQFVLRDPDYLAESAKEHGAEVIELPYTERLHAGQIDTLARLTAADETIRGILSTVASLGAASDSYRISRLALTVASISLAVAIINLILA